VDRQGIDLLTKLPRPPLVEEKLLAVLDGEWRTAREIYAMFAEGGADGTRNALGRLAGAGRIERRYDPLHAGQIARYRKLPDASGPD
jgi:hypothetical protein